MNRMREWLELENELSSEVANSCMEEYSDRKEYHGRIYRDKKLMYTKIEKRICEIEERGIGWHIFNFLMFGIPGLNEIKKYHQKLNLDRVVKYFDIVKKNDDKS